MEAARSSERSPIVTNALWVIQQRLHQLRFFVVAMENWDGIDLIGVPSFDELSDHLFAQTARACVESSALIV